MSVAVKRPLTDTSGNDIKRPALESVKHDSVQVLLFICIAL